MSDSLTKLFAIFGIIALTAIIFVIGKLFFDAICELIDRKKWEYEYKHRFNKPPTAKCYCKDCKWWIKENNRCVSDVISSKRYTPDNGFCYEAEAREKENINGSN